jgi:hypothetical protein
MNGNIESDSHYFRFLDSLFEFLIHLGIEFRHRFRLISHPEVVDVLLAILSSRICSEQALARFVTPLVHSNDWRAGLMNSAESLCFAHQTFQVCMFSAVAAVPGGSGGSLVMRASASIIHPL